MTKTRVQLAKSACQIQAVQMFAFAFKDTRVTIRDRNNVAISMSAVKIPNQLVDLMLCAKIYPAATNVHVQTAIMAIHINQCARNATVPNADVNHLTNWSATIAFWLDAIRKIKNVHRVLNVLQ
jgi:hypothetical protein